MQMSESVKYNKNLKFGARPNVRMPGSNCIGIQLLICQAVDYKCSNYVKYKCTNYNHSPPSIIPKWISVKFGISSFLKSIDRPPNFGIGLLSGFGGQVTNINK